MQAAALPLPPKWRPPAGAADCHAPIMGPFDRFPSVDPGNLPPLAPIENFVAGLDILGFSYGVAVQSSTHGTDCAVIMDALARYPRLRGVALADVNTPDSQLQAMHEAGVRGLRFTGTPRPSIKQGGNPGSVSLDTLYAMAPRMKALGWHAQLWLHCDALLEATPRLTRLGVPLVLDHMGRFDPQSGLQHPGFRNLQALLRDEQVWIKLVPQRNSELFPDYPDVRPFQEALVRANPDRLTWASDWPHNRSGDKLPEGGHLLDLFGQWVTDATLRKKILVDNPAALYGFPPAG